MTKLTIRIIIWILAFLAAIGTIKVSAKSCIDETGRTVNIPASPHKIVSLAPDITEILFALGLEKKIAGVTIFSDYPESASKKAKIGSYMNLSLEKIVSLNPDLIIGTTNGNRKEAILKLEKAGYPVYVVNPMCLKDIFIMIDTIGTITGKESEAQKIVAAMENQVNHIVSMTEKLDKPKVLILFDTDPFISAGKETVYHELIALAGGHNIAGQSPVKYPRLSMETVINEQPDIIIIPSMKKDTKIDGVIKTWKPWCDIPAVKNGRIHIINSDLTDRFSPRITEGLEQLAVIIHPELSLYFNGQGTPPSSERYPVTHRNNEKGLF